MSGDAYLGDFPDDGDPHEYMPEGAPCDERCFWCGATDRPDGSER